MKTIQIDPGDPNNDQMLAMTFEDMSQHMVITRQVIDQAKEQNAPLSSVIAVLAINWIEDEQMTRERLSSLLALALVQNQAHHLENESKEFTDFLKKMIGGT